MAVPSVVRRSFHAQTSGDSYTASQESLRGPSLWPVSGRYSEKVGRPVSLSLMMHRALDLLGLATEMLTHSAGRLAESGVKWGGQF